MTGVGRPAYDVSSSANSARNVVVAPRRAELALELDERGHERLGHEAAAELAEAAETDGLGTGGPEHARGAPRGVAGPERRSVTVVHPVVGRGLRVGHPAVARRELLARLARRGDEAPELPGVLVARARRGLDTARTRRHPTAAPAGSPAPRCSVQPAGEQQPHAGGHRVGERPVERRRPSPARRRRRARCRPDRCRPRRARGRRRRTPGSRTGPGGGPSGRRRAARGRGAARPTRPSVFTISTTRSWTLVAEHADGDDARREAVQDLADGLGRDLAWASRREVEAEGVGTERDGEERVLLVRDAADLHPHRLVPRVPETHFGARRTFVACMEHCSAAPVRTWSACASSTGCRSSSIIAAYAVLHELADTLAPGAHVEPQLGFDEWRLRRHRADGRGSSASCGTRAIRTGTTTRRGSCTSATSW